MLERGKLCVFVFWGSLGFYSSVESNSYACATSLFHIGKILINGRISQNPLCIRILFMLGFYGIGLIVRRKLFPFKIPWRPHNYQSVPRGPLVHPPRSIHTGPIHLPWSVKPIQMDPSSINSNPSPHYSSSLVAPSPRESVLSEWTDTRGDGLILNFWRMPPSMDRLA